MQYMRAVLWSHAKEIRDDGSIVEIMIWELDEPLPPSTHRYKYRLYYGAAGVGRVRYDNERGKGDHRHLGDVEHDIFSHPSSNCSKTLDQTLSAGGNHEGRH
jgi:hypothetical protein